METQPAAPGASPSRLTLGLLFSYLGDQVRGPAWLQAVETARALPANVITFVGDNLHPELCYRPARNHVFALARPEVVDGLVLPPRLLNLTSLPLLESFLTRYERLPMVTFGGRAAGLPSVTVDLAGALAKAIQHLVQVHNRRRIALLSGPKDWDEQDHWTATYRATLIKLGLPVDENLIVSAAGERAPAAAAVARLFGPSAARPDALIAASDRAACQALKDLAALGLAVPGDVAVIGCDDLSTSRLEESPLTTIAVPYGALAGHAVGMLARWLQKREKPADRMEWSALQLRTSCGCGQPLESSVLPRAPDGEGRLAAVLGARRQHLLIGLTAALTACLSSGVQPEIRDLAALLDDFLAALAGEGTESFSARFRHRLRGWIGLHRNPTPWFQALLELHAHVLAFQADPEGRERGLQLVLSALRDGQAYAWRMEERQRMRENENWRLRSRAGLDLIRGGAPEQLPETAASVAAQMGIPRFCACLYEGQALPSSHIRVCLAAKDGRPVAVHDLNALIHVSELPPRFLFPRNEPFSVALLPILASDCPGFLVMEQASRDWTVYHEFGMLLSAALRETVLRNALRERDALRPNRM